MILLILFAALVLLFIVVAVDSFLPAVIIWILLNIFNMTGTLTFWSIWLACGLFDLLIALVKD
jgi:hypothetical protein